MFYEVGNLLEILSVSLAHLSHNDPLWISKLGVNHQLFHILHVFFVESGHLILDEMVKVK